MIPIKKLAIAPVALKGLTQKNRGSEADWDITSAVVYVRQGASTQTLLHEFLHVLGLEHPEFRPPYYVNIGRSVFSNYLYPEKERIYFEQRFYMSSQEKAAVRMLYSPEIKSGLKKEVFEASVSGLVK